MTDSAFNPNEAGNAPGAGEFYTEEAAAAAARVSDPVSDPVSAPVPDTVSAPAPAPAGKKRPKWKIVVPIVITVGVLLTVSAAIAAALFFRSAPLESAERSFASLFSDLAAVPSLADGGSVEIEGRIDKGDSEFLPEGGLTYRVSVASDGNRNESLSASLDIEEADEIRFDAAVVDGTFTMSFPALYGSTGPSLNMKTLPDDLAASVLAPDSGSSLAMDRETYDALMELCETLSDMMTPEEGEQDTAGQEAWADAFRALRDDFLSVTKTGSAPMLVEVNGKQVLTYATVFEADEDKLPALIDAFEKHIVKNDALSFPALPSEAEGESFDLREFLLEIVDELRQSVSEEPVSLSLVLYESFGRLVRVDFVTVEGETDKNLKPVGDAVTDVVTLAVTPGKNGRLHLVVAETETDGGEEFTNLHFELDFDRTAGQDTLTIDIKTPVTDETGTVQQSIRIEGAVKRSKAGAFTLDCRVWVKSDEERYPRIHPEEEQPVFTLELTGTLRSGRQNTVLTLSDLSVSGKNGDDALDMSMDGQFLSVTLTGGKQTVEPIPDAVPMLSMSEDELRTLVDMNDRYENGGLLAPWNDAFGGRLFRQVVSGGYTAASVVNVDPVSNCSPIPYHYTSGSSNTVVRYDPVSGRVFIGMKDTDGQYVIQVYDGTDLSLVDTLAVKYKIHAMDAYDGILAYSLSGGNATVQVLDASTLTKKAEYEYRSCQNDTLKTPTATDLWITEDKLWLVTETGSWESICSIDRSTGSSSRLNGNFREPYTAINRATNTMLVAETGTTGSSVYVLDMATGTVTKNKKTFSLPNGRPYFYGTGFLWASNYYYDAAGNEAKKPKSEPSLPSGYTYTILWEDKSFTFGWLIVGNHANSDPTQVIVTDENGEICGGLAETNLVLAFLKQQDGEFLMLVNDTQSESVLLTRFSVSLDWVFGPQ